MTTAVKYYTPDKNEIETASGLYLNVKDPRPENITLEDIAHGLSNVCRYGGHTKRFYSVAEHAVFVAERVKRQGGNKNLQIMALHHDDAEAFLGDIPRPLKPLLGPAYGELSDRMDEIITEALDLPMEWEMMHDPEIKAADDWAVFVEARILMTSEGKGWSGLPRGRAERIPGRIVVPDYFHGGINPSVAKELYLEKHYELVGRHTNG